MFHKGNDVQILVGQYKGKMGEIVDTSTDVGGLVLYHVLITESKPHFTMQFSESEIQMPYELRKGQQMTQAKKFYKHGGGLFDISDLYMIWLKGNPNVKVISTVYSGDTLLVTYTE